MPKSGPNERLAKYAAKLDPEHVKRVLEAQRERMVSAQDKAFNDLATIEDRVKAVLAEEDVLSVQYIWYYDFARQHYSLQKRFGGGKALKRESDLLVYVWKDRGCDEDLLNRIRFEVFGLKA